MMAKKDYQLIADTIKGQLAMYDGPLPADNMARSVLKATAYRLANELANDNPAFKRALFIEACGFPLPLRS